MIQYTTFNSSGRVVKFEEYTNLLPEFYGKSSYTIVEGDYRDYYINEFNELVENSELIVDLVDNTITFENRELFDIVHINNTSYIITDPADRTISISFTEPGEYNISFNFFKYKLKEITITI